MPIDQTGPATARTALRTTLVEPIVCRCPGLPFSRLDELSGNYSQEALWRLLDDPGFVDCLATMHHAALPGLRSRRARMRPGHRPSDIRRAEMTLYRYLARFCSRNDTTGTAGSTFWGRLDGDATEVVPARGGGKARVVWMSPRRVELLSHRAARGLLRDRARLLLFPRYVWTGSDLLDPHGDRNLELSSAQADLVGRVAADAPLMADLDPAERDTADTLIEQQILTLRLGRPQQDTFQVLLEASQGTALEDDLRRLASYRERLCAAAGVAFASLMEEAEKLASHLVDCPVLELPEILSMLVHGVLESPGLDLVVSPTVRLEGDRLTDAASGETRVLDQGEREVVVRGRQPVPSVALLDYEAEVHRLLEEGVLTLPGAEDFRPGWPWKVRFAELSRALAEAGAGMPERLSRVTRLLAAVHPSEPVRMAPLEAEAQLGGLLGDRREKFTNAALDRAFFICDSTRPMRSFGIGGALRRRLERQLAGWFRLTGWQAYNRERMMLPVLRSLTRDRESVPLSRFLHELAVRLHRDDVDTDSPDLIVRRRKLVEEDDARWKVAVDASGFLAIEEAETFPDFERWLRGRRLVTTMDLMLGGTVEALEAGGGTMLVAEAHGGGEGLAETTMFPQSHPRHSLQGHCRRVFGEDTLFLQPPMPSKQSAAILLQLQDAALAIDNPESGWPQARTVPIGRLRVRGTARGLVVEDGERTWRLITEDLAVGNIQTVGYAPLAIARWACSKVPGFSRPGPVEVYPEVRLGDLVLTRPTVRLPAGLARRLIDEEPHGSQLREALGLPRFGFVKTTKKPMLCDFECPISVEVLAAELSRADEATFSPMLPAPEDFWLRLEDGPYGSELRVVAAAEGPDFVDGPDGCLLEW